MIKPETHIKLGARDSVWASITMRMTMAMKMRMKTKRE
jgi:hypothetical protein